MPNYSLQVDNSRYYDPTLRNTLQAYADTQEQDMRAAEAAYGEMTSKANMLEKLANDVKGKDSVAYQNYMNYANALRQHTDLLATQGLNPSVWKNIIQAKNDYSRIIHPIEEAYQAREKEAQRQAEYMKQHPGAVFERNAYNMGIDQWMKNPHYTAQVIDKETIANRAKERFAALKTQLMEFVSQNGGLNAIMTKNPDAVKRWFKAKAPWLYESMYKTGANPEDVKKLLAGDPEMESSMLQGIVNDTVRMSGIDSWNTDYDHYTAEQNAQNRQNLFDQIYTSVRGEAPNAIGETKFDKYEDRISADLLKQKIEIAARAAEAEADRAWKEKMAAIASGGGDNKDPKVHTYYRDFEYIVPNEETKTTKAAQLLALKNLLDKSPNARGFYRGFTEDQILNAVKSVFGKDITEVDLDNDVNDNKLREALFNSNKDNNNTFPWSDSSLENEEQYNDYIVNNYVNNAFGMLKPLTNEEATALMKQDMSKMSLDDKKRLYKYLTTKNLNKVSNEYDLSDFPGGFSNVYSNEDEDIRKDLVNQLVTEMYKDETNPYEKKIDDLIGTEDNDIYDYNTRVNNYIKGATTTYEGAEDNFEGSARTNQSSLLWGQSLQGVRKGSKDIALNVHTLDANGNKVDVKQDDVINALGIDKNGEITRPYRTSIVPLRNKKTGEIEVHPMIRTQGYYDNGKYHEGIDFEWNHDSVKENKETRDINLKQMNLNLNRAEAVKKSKEFKNIVANADNVAKSYLESNKMPLTRKNISDVKYEYIKQELERLQKPYMDAYNFHKSEFMRLWGHATGNTNIANSINHDKTGELDADFHVTDLGASN